MEKNYPTLKRPKRKLCYLTNKESSSKQWAGTLRDSDIDKMFDDLDPSSHDTGDACPLFQTFDVETEASPVPLKGHLTEELPICQMGPKGDSLHPATRSLSPQLVIADLDIPFKAHGPVKTSSPIDENMVVKCVEEQDEEKDQTVSPLLFVCEDEEKEDADTAEPQPIQEPQCNGHVAEESDISELESPPSKVALIKPAMSSQKNKVEASCTEKHPVKEKTPNKPKTPVLESKRKTPRREHTDPPVSAVRPEPELTTHVKEAESVHRQPSVKSSCGVKDMTAFLKKLREAVQPKPAGSRKSLSPVKVPTPPPPPPPEPEDDFVILDDDSALWLSIPSKPSTSKNQTRSKTSSTDRDSSTDKGSTKSPRQTPQKQQESEQTKSKVGSQTVNQKTKKMKSKEKKNEEAVPENDKDELPTPEDLPAVEEEKPNKKKRLKKVPSKEMDKEEEQPKEPEKPTPLEIEKKTQKSDMKRAKSLKDGKENAKTSRAKSLKGARKVTQGSEAVTKEPSQSSEEHADTEDLDSPSDKEIMPSEAPTEKVLADGKDKHNKLPAASEGSSSEDSQILGKRKRRQPGQWWLDHQTTEETKVTDNQPSLKKAKQNNKERSAAVPSPVKAKKERVLKKRRQTQPAAPSASQKTNKEKEKKTKQNKNRRGDTQDKVFDTIEAEQIEEQEAPDLDLDQDLDEQSSPLVLTHRDHSLHSGEHVFQKVYHHHASSENLSTTPAPASPRRLTEQLRSAESSEKRRRKPPGSWWLVDDKSEEVESVSSRPPLQEPRPLKERKKQSNQIRSPRLGTPKRGNMAVSPKPAGGAPVPPLKLKSVSAPKTVKRSLAMFNDIFTSAAETPTVVSSRGAGQKQTRKVAARPAEEITVTDCSLVSNNYHKETLSMDTGESQNSPPNAEAPQDSRCQSEDKLKLLRSGPSSMIMLEEYEEDEDLILPPARVHAALSLSDLCAPPLKPLVLQLKDKANLREWFKSLWPIPADKGADITPDHFDWYFYQGRAIGFLEDLNSGSICNGKILLGSFMKKPLWVDHSATTVFNLLTSSVSVTIDSKESRFHPGQSFMVPCGHAYSIQNVVAQPAVLYFTRILTENSD